MHCTYRVLQREGAYSGDVREGGGDHRTWPTTQQGVPSCPCSTGSSISTIRRVMVAVVTDTGRLLCCCRGGVLGVLSSFFIDRLVCIVAWHICVVDTIYSTKHA